MLLLSTLRRVALALACPLAPSIAFAGNPKPTFDAVTFPTGTVTGVGSGPSTLMAGNDARVVGMLPFFLGAGTACDTSQWTAFIGGTQSPQPMCFTSKSSSAINVPFPGVVGIGNATGGSVPINDQTYIQFAQNLIQSQTAMDNAHQECALCINMVSKTGGGGLPQTLHNQKVALYIPTLAVPGAANTWSINDDLEVLSGVGNYSMYRHEGDMTNFNGDYVVGGCGPCAAGSVNGSAVGDFLTFTGYPITSGFLLDGNPNSGSASMHYGMLFQHIQGFNTVGTGLISDSTISDSTNSHTSLLIAGHHDTGLNTTLGTMAYAAVFAAGQNQCFNALQDCFSYNVNGTGLQYVSASGLVYSLSDAGNQTVYGTSSVGAGLAASLLMQGASAGYGPLISAQGQASSIPITLQPKNSLVQVSGGLSVSGLSGAGSLAVCVTSGGTLYTHAPGGC